MHQIAVNVTINEKEIEATKDTIDKDVERYKHIGHKNNQKRPDRRN